MNDDTGLRDRFAALRREDAARTPGFTEVVRRQGPAPRPAPRALAVAASLAMAGLLVAGIWGSRHRPPPGTAAAAPWLADWQSPTDFLLDTPGRELLHAVPRIGDPSADVLDPFPQR